MGTFTEAQLLKIHVSARGTGSIPTGQGSRILNTAPKKARLNNESKNKMASDSANNR